MGTSRNWTITQNLCFINADLSLVSVLTYCPAHSQRWAVSAGWSVYGGSERSKCSHSWCLLGERLKSTSLRSEPGTLSDPAAASESLREEKEIMDLSKQ